MKGYKHFSHSHNLVIHQMPEGTEVSCSGCNSSANRTVYVCWQCNFFLHDQCFRATRSLKHPSHPSHSLTLVPYPTYPSNSFYCNSCQIMGTGFSYSCADCEFDLHVHCAHSISIAPSFQEPVLSSWNGIHDSNITNNAPLVSVIGNHSIPLIHAHNQAYAPQSPIPNANNPPMGYNIAPVSVPTSSQNPIPTVPLSFQLPVPAGYPLPPQNEQKDNTIRHFIHPHNLSSVNLKDNKENGVVCSSCKETNDGNGYSCVEPNCSFHLDEFCFNLKKQIQHKSHPEHPLILHAVTPYKTENKEFTCDACFNNGTGFSYHCSICKFDLHIYCATLPETMKRDDHPHDHTLRLLYSCPVQGEGIKATCEVCFGSVRLDGWAYYCGSCNYGTHVECVNSKRREKENVEDLQVQLQKMQLEMQMTQQLGQMFADMGASIANSVG